MSRLRPARRVTADGAAWGLVAEGVALPAGLLAAAFLTRQFGPEGYGGYALAVALVVWLEGVVVAFLSKATVRFVSTEADDRDRVETTVWRLHLGAGLVVGAAVFAFAAPIADALGLPDLTGYLRLLALSPPFAAAAAGHEFILVGRRRYRERAVVRAVRWVGRLVLIVALVAGGLEIEGALWGVVGAAALAFALARVWARPALGGPAFPLRPILQYAVPLLLSGLALRVLRRIDVFALKGFGASAAEVGYYTAAQNLALVPGMVALAFTPLVLASLGQALGAGSVDLAKEMSRDALRVPFLLLPFAALGAGAAPALVTFIYGEAFAPAAPLLAPLLGVGIALVVVALGANVLTAIGRPRLTTLLTAPLVGLVVAAMMWAVPRYGAMGAALSAASVATLGAVVMVLAVRRVWGVAPAWGTLARSAVATAAAYLAGGFVAESGAFVLVALVALAVALVLLLRWTGEIDDRDLATVRAVLPSRLVFF